MYEKCQKQGRKALLLPVLFILAVMTNYYKTLELEDFAAIEEIKRAHRRLSKRYHPDLNNGNKYHEEKFKEIQHAYEQLSDPITKENLDSYLRWQASRYKEPVGRPYGQPHEPQTPFGPYPDNGEDRSWWQRFRVPTLATIVLSLSWQIYNANKEQPVTHYKGFIQPYADSIRQPGLQSMTELEVRSVRKGATKREILNTAGNPDEILTDSGEEIWIYGSSTITFSHDTVVDYSDVMRQFEIKR